ncbi:MAG: transcriptional regulator, partial [Kiloniellales bacterium]|nr:transcriptional regulator [Kiloniellales bacterium]
MPERESRRHLFLALLLGVTTLMGFVLFYALSVGLPGTLAALLRDNIREIFGLARALVLGGTAYFLNNRRFFYYAALSVILVAAARLLQIPLGFAVGALGVVVLGVGAIKLVRFLQEYPSSRRIPMGAKHPAFESLLIAGEIDKIVHEPARLMLLSILYVIDSADFVFLHNQTGLTRGNFSTHMSKLEGAGYIHVTKEFADRRPMTILQITDED